MFSWLSKTSSSRKAPDALPATATAVQEVEAPTASRRLDGAPGEEPSTTASADKRLVLRTSVCYLPHPDKVYYGGEDAYFVSDVGGGALGVADGVGGWQESGINPADYSRLLMKVACAYLEGKDLFANDGVDRPMIDPQGALHAAHQHTKVPGSATACVMQLDVDNNTLEAANLGDSGFVVVRQGQVVARSKPLQHYFDCPLQFGAFPEYVEATDTADMADLYSIPLLPGDVIVAGSDGLWDNAFESEIVALAPRAPGEVQRSADRIAATARTHASDNEFASPYIREALQQGLDLPWWEKLVGASFKNGKFALKQLSGGKMDDITVMVALVDAVDPPPPPPPPPEAQLQPPQPAEAAAEAPPAPAVAAQASGSGSAVGGDAAVAPAQAEAEGGDTGAAAPASG